MKKCSIEATRKIERNILITAAIIDSLTILILQLERLSAQVEFSETLSRSDEAFVGGTAETHSGTLTTAIT